MATTTFLRKIDMLVERSGISWQHSDHEFYLRLIAYAGDVQNLFNIIYGSRADSILLFEELISLIINSYKKRDTSLKNRDSIKEKESKWFLSNQLTGMSLYVDRFCGTLKELPTKLNYLEELGINVLHLMPLFKSPQGASDGGYAVSDFREINSTFGNLKDLLEVQQKMMDKGMYLMLDIVLNHTSDQHEWARKAAMGEQEFQDYYYMYNDRSIPDEFDQSMPEIFPETAPGNFTYVEKCHKWVMTVFHNYQWDLNYTNPYVFLDMMDNIFFYANLGVDILRIDAPAFIWKESSTTCQNLPKAHTILQLIKVCVEIATPGMALLGEAIVAPNEIMQYFGTAEFKARECDLAYNATQMALQWDALATENTSVLIKGQEIILSKPLGTSWITYTRCHDDIGLGYDDGMITAGGFEPYAHRSFIKNYYTGNYFGSNAKGSLFSYNPKTGDARISGTLASLCGLESAVESGDMSLKAKAIKRILLMQGMSLLIGGLPMLYYGDEVGFTNDYSYLEDDSKNYDNRWMHRPIINWNKNNHYTVNGTVENVLFNGLKQLIQIRQGNEVFKDLNNIQWIWCQNNHVAGFVRYSMVSKVACLFNFSQGDEKISWYVLREFGLKPGEIIKDHLSGDKLIAGIDEAHIELESYGMQILEWDVS